MAAMAAVRSAYCHSSAILSSYLSIVEKSILKCRGLEGQKVLDATLTVITDTGEVATSLWSHSTSLDVVKDNLRQLYKRFLKRGCRVRTIVFSA